MSAAKTFGKKEFDALAKPFDKKTLGIKVQCLNKAKTAAMLVPYVQHTDVYTRIEAVDPSWSNQVTDVEVMRLDGLDTTFAVVALTILGVTRTNTGQGEDLKSATSDGIKRAAMLFGVARYLYDVEPVWIEYSPAADYGRVYTYDDYEAARKRGQPVLPTGPEPAPAAVAESRALTVEDLERELIALGKDLGWEAQRVYNEAEKFCDKALDDISIPDMQRFAEHLRSQKSAPSHRRGFGR